MALFTNALVFIYWVAPSLLGEGSHRRSDDKGSFYSNSPQSWYLSGKCGQSDNYYGGRETGSLNNSESNTKNHLNFYSGHSSIHRRGHENNDSEEYSVRGRLSTYRNLQMINRDINHGQIPAVGSENMIFTHLSKETDLNDYKKEMNNSMVFTFVAHFDFTANFNLLSTTKGYHPQLILSETTDEKTFNKVKGYGEYGNYSSKYELIKDHIYIIEIGTISDIKTGGFENVEKGGFIAIFSSTARPLPEIMEEENIEVGSDGFIGHLVYRNMDVLKLRKSSGMPVSYGKLSYELTPYYDKNQKSVSIFYIEDSDEKQERKNKSSKVEIKATNHIKDYGTSNYLVYYGKEQKDSQYSFLVASKMINELISLIK